MNKKNIKSEKEIKSQPEIKLCDLVIRHPRFEIEDQKIGQAMVGLEPKTGNLVCYWFDPYCSGGDVMSQDGLIAQNQSADQAIRIMQKL